MIKREEWPAKFIGRLDKNRDMIVVKDGNTLRSAIRYPIEVVSNHPNDMPDNAFLALTSFSTDLEEAGYYDDSTMSEDERKIELEEYLEAHYLLFRIKSRQNEGERTFYNPSDIEIVRKENDKIANFSLVPIIKSKGKENEILEKLFNNEFLEMKFSLSKDSADYPSFILITNDISYKDEDYLTVFGPIENMLYSEEYGYKFISNPQKTFYIKIKIKDLGESYFSKDNVCFLTWDNESEIIKKLEEEGKKIDGVKQKKKIEDIDEKDFLDTFKEVALSKKLFYKPSNINNFHTAMKTQSFVILAGMSGTGKSKIVECYHEALNKFANKPFKESNSSKRSKLLFVPVRPFWQDDSDLLGYLDSTQGIYRPGDSGLVDFIKEANENPHECYIVCLDEMNLAKVEHYFSQFLSILERDIKDRNIYLYNEKFEGRVYNHIDYAPKLKLSENLFFVGTVNIDESTHQFSDKVLDRANIITLELSSYEEIRNQTKTIQSEKTNLSGTNEEPLRTYQKLKSMKRTNDRNTLVTEEIDLLWKIHLEMQTVNNQLGIGYRIVEQIENYIANLPLSEDLSRKEALDLQITQRVLTKLRGSQGQLSNLIGSFESGEYKEGEIYILLDNYQHISEFSSSKVKLKNLAKELEEYGHTI